jgi:hypothetical protein
MKESDVYLDYLEIRSLNMYVLDGYEHPLAASTRDKTSTGDERGGAIFEKGTTESNCRIFRESKIEHPFEIREVAKE